MKSTISGERYILVGENVILKDFLTYLATLLNTKVPTIYASKTMTSIAWRLDWLIAKITNRKKKLTRTTAKASHSVDVYDTSKIVTDLNYSFQKKETYLPKII